MPGGRDEWYAREFRLVKDALHHRKYAGVNRWWAPVNNSTFVEVPDEEYTEFEEAILKPYFDTNVDELLVI